MWAPSSVRGVVSHHRPHCRSGFLPFHQLGSQLRTLVTRDRMSVFSSTNLGLLSTLSPLRSLQHPMNRTNRVISVKAYQEYSPGRKRPKSP